MSNSSVIRPRSTSYNSIDDEVHIDEEAIDTGLIRCICNSSEDDGFTIQCERCLVWQHAFCVKISQNNIPEHYLCDRCEKKINNAHRGHNKAWREQLEQFNKAVENDVRPSTGLDRKHQQQRRHQLQHQQLQSQSSSDFNNNNSNNISNNISNSNGLNNSHMESSGKHHFRDIHNRMGGDEDTKLSRKKNPVGRPPKRPKLSKKISVSKRSLQELELQDDVNISNKNNTHNDASSPRKRRQEHISIGESSNNGATSINSRRLAAYDGTAGSGSGGDFQPISYNVIRSKHAKQVFKDTRERLTRLEKGKGKPNNNGISSPTNKQQQQSIITPHIIFEEEAIKQDSTLKVNIQPLSNKRTTTTINDIPTHRRRQRQQQGLFANAAISQNQLVAEVHGDIILKSEYKFDPGNDFSVLGTPCAHVFFYPTIDLCIDARYRGNDTRKIRRSCHPNAELRSIVARHTPDEEIRLGIFSRTSIEKGDEITIGYGWQRGHISWKKNLEWHDCGMTDGHQVIDEEEERSSRSALSRMLNYFSDEFGDCACDDENLCFIEHLKAIQSGSDERPLTTFKVPPSSSKEGSVRNNNDNTSISRVEDEKAFSSTQTITSSKEVVDSGFVASQPPPSRQTAVISNPDNTTNHNHNMTKAEYPVTSVEDNVLIDIVSTSPLVRSPVISAPSATVSPDIEDELDVDDDIDIGEEFSTTANYAKRRRRRRHQRSDSDSSSSLSNYLGSDSDARNQKGGKRVRTSSTKSENGEKPSKRHSGSPKMDENNNNSKSKLPCKKAWIRNFMQQGTVSSPPASPTISTASSHVLSDGPKDEPDNTNRQLQPKSSPTLSSNGQQRLEDVTTSLNKSEKMVTTKAEQENNLSSPPSHTGAPTITTTTAVIDMDLDEDDGELSDASSASTIPIMEQDDDRLMMNGSSKIKQDEEERNSNPVVDKNVQESEKEPESSTSLVNKNKSPSEHNKKDDDITEPSPVAADMKEEKTALVSTTSDSSNTDNVKQQQSSEENPESSEVKKITSQQQLPVADESSEKQKENQSTVTEQLQRQSSSEADEQKPTKVKLSLQEYLARRGTSNQGSVRTSTEGKSSTPSPSSSSPQDCSSSSRAKTEEHPWIAATSQVEVTMETRQSDAQ